MPPEHVGNATSQALSQRSGNALGTKSGGSLRHRTALFRANRETHDQASRMPHV
jgi:hypothetical protein